MAAVNQGKGIETAIESIARENTKILLGAVRTHYEPVTNEERRLDKSINFKMDVLVISVLAIDFLLQGIDKTNVGFAAASSSKFAREYQAERYS